MPEIIDNYTSQKVFESLKKRALLIWGAVLFISGIWVSATLFAPIAAAFEAGAQARPVYDFFGYVCHQMPARSFHLLGHQFAVCSRCFGVYFGILLGLLVYPLFRSMENAEPLPRFWLFLAIVPMGIDWSLTFFGIWENTHFTRVSTGIILGFACAVFIVPALIELAQMQLSRKRRKLKKAV